MREAGRMDEWAPGELTEGLEDGERWALKMLRKAKMKDAETGRLPDVPDWRDGAARQTDDDLLVQCRLIVAEHLGDGLSEIIEAILKETGINSKELAALLNVDPRRVSEAMHGKPRPGFVARFTEILGEGKED